jgi:leucyl/phenylalanyl-tRNA---protein transferase
VFPPLEPDDTGIEFPDPADANEYGVVAVGEDFRPGTVLRAYRQGIFPWPHRDEARASGATGARRGHVVLWCSPDPRAIFPLEREPHWSRSLRRTLRSGRFRVTLNQAFGEVIRMCGKTRAEGTWIIPALIRGYEDLHRRGFAHSVEVWEDDELVGGIYGMAIGGVFAGESMFHTRTDASKVAFAHLAVSLRASGFAVFDVQVENPHLLSLGCVEIPRSTYILLLQHAQKKSPQLTLTQLKKD